MIRIIRRLLTRRKVPALQAEIVRLEAEYLDAIRRHRARAHLAERLQSKRHDLLRAQLGK